GALTPAPPQRASLPIASGKASVKAGRSSTTPERRKHLGRGLALATSATAREKERSDEDHGTPQGRARRLPLSARSARGARAPRYVDGRPGGGGRDDRERGGPSCDDRGPGAVPGARPGQRRRVRAAEQGAGGARRAPPAREPHPFPCLRRTHGVLL